MRHVRLYAPAVLLMLCALWVWLVSDAKACAVVWLVILFGGVWMSTREKRRHHRGR